MGRNGEWMQTATGRQYWPLDPRPGEVVAEDIAHHLSMLCRFCGACTRFYSVAEHSMGVLVVATAQAEREGVNRARIQHLQVHALLHDAAEAYCHDLIRPIKRCVVGYAEVEAANYEAICERFGLARMGVWARQIIKKADDAMLLAEQEAIMRPPPVPWAPAAVPSAMRDDARKFLADNGDGWPPEQAKGWFLSAMTLFRLA